MRVLLATDGSDDARAAAAYLGGLPMPADTQVRVISVVAIPPSPIDIPTVRDFQGSLHEEARAIADAAAATLVKRARTVEARVIEGDPRDALVRAAEEWPADLVVLGARGLSGVAGFLLGSVSLAVTRHAHCSVLVVKGTVRPVRRVVIAVDGSEPAAAAVGFVAGLPLGAGATVSLVGVVERPRFPATTPAAVSGLVREGIDRIVAERSAALADTLDRAAAPFESRGTPVSRRVAVGHPSRDILEMAEAEAADLIVMGARGLGGLKRLLLGSVSEAVLCDASRPVLIVRSAVA